jgi:hypothetical protein
MNAIPHQPATAFAGWFEALKGQGDGWGFLVLRLEGRDGDSFVQIIYDQYGFILDHPLANKSQRARRKQLLQTLAAEGVSLRGPRRADTVLAQLPHSAAASARIVQRLFARVFGARPRARYQIEWSEFVIKPGDEVAEPAPDEDGPWPASQ